jgi:hypothetical protein
MHVRVWLGGEGSCEIGDRDRPGGARVGAIEALLLRVEPKGWSVAGATVWRQIRKYTVGAARGRDNHGDIHNIAGLVNHAFEAGCQVVAFSRDVDAEIERTSAIQRGIDYAQERVPRVAIIGGPAKPAIEGWILALLGVRDSEKMSRERANRELAQRGTSLKQPEDYVAVIELRSFETLPPGSTALQTWIKRAKSVLGDAIRGAAAE